MNRIQHNNFFVITGGPGVGKTTLLNELNKRYICVPEIARAIIREQMKINGKALPWKNKKRYAELMLRDSVESYLKLHQTTSDKELVFFDRGIPDTVCYANMVKVELSPHMSPFVDHYLYNSTVFILPPWREIYQTDRERKQTWKEAVFTYKKMKETYQKYGYNITEVPKASVKKRVKFVLENID